MSQTAAITGRAVHTLPSVWPGYCLVVGFFIVEVGEFMIDPLSGEKVTPIPLLIGLTAQVYWFFCIYRIHQVLAEVTDSAYPIGPVKAVGFHLIPFFNIYWLFRWTSWIANFVNANSTSVRMSKYWPGFFLFVSVFLARIDGALSLVVLFSTVLYIRRKLGLVVLG